MKALHMVTWILLIIGGLNWLLTAFHYNVVDMVFGMDSTIGMIIYVLVGLSAIFEVVNHKNTCRNCNPMGGSGM